MNNTESFFGTDIVLSDTKGKVTNTKDWSQDWLKVKEHNLLSMGGTKISRPYEQSYTIYRSIRSIAENVPQALYRIYYINGDVEVPVNHPVSKLFNRPNQYMSRWELWESTSTYLNLYGEAFIYMNGSVGQAAGTSSIPSELVPLNPRYMKHCIEDGQVVGWLYNNLLSIENRELIHVKFYNPNDPIRGLSPIGAIKQEMESDYSAGSYNKIFFDNGATPDGVVEVDKDKEVDIDELRKLKRLWNQNHAGTSNAHKVAFLLGGMSYKNMGATQKDMDFIALREFSRSAILAVFGVPAFVAGFVNKGEVNRSTAVASKSMFWSNTLVPQILRMQEKLTVDFYMEYAPELYGKFDMSSIPELRPDLIESLTAGKEMFSIGYTRNEINDRLQLDMPTDPDGDIRYLAMNLIEVGDSSDADPADKPNTAKAKDKTLTADKVIDALKHKVKETTIRNFNVVQSRFEQVLHKKIKRYIFDYRKNILKLVSNIQESVALVDEIAKTVEPSKEKLIKLIRPVFLEIMTQAAGFAFDNLGLERAIHNIETKAPEFIIDQAVLDARLNMVTGITDTMFNQLKAELQEGILVGETIPMLADRTRSVFNVISNRSITIARTESSSLMNGTAATIYKDEGVAQKEWVATQDSETRESHAAIDGEVVQMDSTFSNGLMFPGDPNGSAKEVVNCRCTISPVIE